MDTLKLNIDKIFEFVPSQNVYGYKKEIELHNASLDSKTGKGNDFLGWVNLPSSISENELKEMENAASAFKNKVEIVVVIGIGGSYLGSKAVIEALSNSFQSLQKTQNNPLVLFAGQNISEDYMFELIETLNDKKYGIVVISKSGTTTEPAVAFRILKDHLEAKVGKAQAKDLIIAITDEKKGALRTLANKVGYKSFVISDDIGGRFSVLTPVGLIPIALAGFNIRQLVEGAKSMEKATAKNVPFESNPAAIYAAARNALYNIGKTTEILAGYNPKMVYFSEWWKQLYGESEGKENKGIFPASVTFTADLHSMGQYIQEGLRNFFETVISIKKVNHQVTIPNDPDNLDTCSNLPLLDVFLSFTGVPATTFTLRIDNYLDQHAEDFRDYPKPGRAYYLALQININQPHTTSKETP
jgi:glucose-6-phosphate isomerase